MKYEINCCPWAEYKTDFRCWADVELSGAAAGLGTATGAGTTADAIEVTDSAPELTVHFVAYETNLRAVNTENQSPVHQDSCVEFFAMFDPECDPHYINFEINPNGAMHVEYRTKRSDARPLTCAELSQISAKAQIFDDRWEVTLHIKTALLESIFLGFKPERGTKIRGNFYKCGDLTDHPHYACHFPIDWEQPDFHRPEFFGEIVL